MTRTKYRTVAAAAGSADEVEAAFYEALQQGDATQLMACWSDDDEIVCVHPGSPRLVGPHAVRAAFEAMLAHGGLRVRPQQMHRVQALGSAVHSVVEHVEVALPDGMHVAVVVATNVYHKTPQGWRMVAHHASAATQPPAGAQSAPATVLH